jgi:hypothetical protein
MTNFLLLLQLVAFTAVLIQISKILMTLQEAVQILTDANTKLDDIGTKLTEAFTEIINLIGQLQNTTLTPEQEAIVTALNDKVTSVQPQAQQLADIVPNPQP